MTVTDTPAIKIVALSDAPELGAATRVTVAEPEPDDAPETVIQLGKLETTQEQEAVVWMLTVKLPPVAGNCSEVGETEYQHAGPDGTKTRMRSFWRSAT